MSRFSLFIEFNPSMLWLGAHVRRRPVFIDTNIRQDWHIHLTLFPMVPLHFIVRGTPQLEDSVS